MASKLTKTTTDHEEIRRWAEDRGAEPAEVERTERDGETGMIRLDFPGYSGAGSLKHISWDEWFQKFDESRLALVYQDRTARGQQSNFNKLIGRETADARAHGENKASRRSLGGSRGRSAARRSGGGTRGGATSTAARRGSARRGAGSAKSSARTRRTAARDSGRTQRSGASGRSGRASKGTREAPRAIAARLTGRGHGSDAAGTRRSPSSGGTSRKGSGRGTTAGRSAGKGRSSATKRSGRSSRRSRR